MVSLLLAVFALACVARAHVCIYDPPQRGPLDISKPGSSTCLRPQFPCGGQEKSKAPYPTFPTYWDREFTISVQENLAHYEVGFPGYIDVAWTNASNPTNESDFTTIGIISDINFNTETHQQNLTFWLRAPNIHCVGCTLRVRYVPHKPGLPTFYQCVDVTFTAQQDLPKRPEPRPQEIISKLSKPLPDGPSNATLLRAISANWWLAADSKFVTVDTVTGRVHSSSVLPFSIRRRSDVRDSDPAFILDQIFAFDANSNTSYFMAYDSGSVSGSNLQFPTWESVPSSLVVVTPHGQRIMPLTGLPSPINALVHDPVSKTLYCFTVTPGTQGNFVLSLGTIDENGAVRIIASAPPQINYLSYQWITLDASSRMIYVLMADEGNGLNQLVAFNISTSTVTVNQVAVDTSKFSISGVIAAPGSAVLWATSPGALQQGHNTAWWVVTVDPTTGAVTPYFEFAPAGSFQPNMNQMVFNYNTASNVLYARLDIADGSYMSLIASIYIQEKSVYFSAPMYYEPLHNLAYTY